MHQGPHRGSANASQEEEQSYVLDDGIGAHDQYLIWEQDGCSEICSKEELWEAAKEVEMSIPLGDSDDVPPEWQYEERF